MILQVLSYPWQISYYRYTKRFQVIGGSNTREHQQLGRIDSSTRKNHFFVGICLLFLTILHICDADCSCPLERDAGYERMGL